jgi:hypothetical protein
MVTLGVIALWMVCLWMVCLWVVCLWVVTAWMVTDSRSPLGVATSNHHATDTTREYRRGEDLHCSFHMFLLHIDTVPKNSIWPSLVLSPVPASTLAFLDRLAHWAADAICRPVVSLQHTGNQMRASW